MNEEVKGWQWTMFAGLVPLAAGLFMYVTSKWNFAHPDSMWSFIVHRLDFSFGQLAAVNPEAGPLVVLLGDLASVNIVSAALAVVLISKFALRRGQKWAWWYLLFALVWVGLHDLYGVTKFAIETGAPMFVMPWTFCILMGIGLYKTRNQIFR